MELYPQPRHDATRGPWGGDEMWDVAPEMRPYFEFARLEHPVSPTNIRGIPCLTLEGTIVSSRAATAIEIKEILTRMEAQDGYSHEQHEVGPITPRKPKPAGSSISAVTTPLITHSSSTRRDSVVVADPPQAKSPTPPIRLRSWVYDVPTDESGDESDPDSSHSEQKQESAGIGRISPRLASPPLDGDRRGTAYELLELTITLRGTSPQVSEGTATSEGLRTPATLVTTLSETPLSLVEFQANAKNIGTLGNTYMPPAVASSSISQPGVIVPVPALPEPVTHIAPHLLLIEDIRNEPESSNGFAPGNPPLLDLDATTQHESAIVIYREDSLRRRAQSEPPPPQSSSFRIIDGRPSKIFGPTFVSAGTHGSLDKSNSKRANSLDSHEDSMDVDKVDEKLVPLPLSKVNCAPFLVPVEVQSAANNVDIAIDVPTDDVERTEALSAMPNNEGINIGWTKDDKAEIVNAADCLTSTSNGSPATSFRDSADSGVVMINDDEKSQAIRSTESQDQEADDKESPRPASAKIHGGRKRNRTVLDGDDREDGSYKPSPSLTRSAKLAEHSLARDKPSKGQRESDSSPSQQSRVNRRSKSSQSKGKRSFTTTLRLSGISRPLKRSKTLITPNATEMISSEGRHRTTLNSSPSPDPLALTCQDGCDADAEGETDEEYVATRHQNPSRHKRDIQASGGPVRTTPMGHKLYSQEEDDTIFQMWNGRTPLDRELMKAVQESLQAKGYDRTVGGLKWRMRFLRATTRKA